jgi:hypothetical protein
MSSPTNAAGPVKGPSIPITIGAASAGVGAGRKRKCKASVNPAPTITPKTKIVISHFLVKAFDVFITLFFSTLFDITKYLAFISLLNFLSTYFT